jgi:hypothetical protein
MKIYRTLVASLGFLALLVCVYLIHIYFFKVDVVLYSSIFDVVLAALLAVSALFYLSFFSSFNAFEKLQMAVIWLLSGALVAISVPTVIDRSLSFYILEKLEQSGGALQLSRFEDLFTRGYSKEHRLVDVRLTEQLESGTVTIEGDCVKLTAHGHRLAGFSRIFRQNLLPKKRLLMGEYTDVLTDPFRDGEKVPGDECL